MLLRERMPLFLPLIAAKNLQIACYSHDNLRKSRLVASMVNAHYSYVSE